MQAHTCKYKPKPCKYKARPANTSPDVQIQAQTCNYLQLQARPTNTRPDLQIQARTCKYNPRPAITSPDLQIQASLINTTQACKYKPRDANTRSGLFLVPEQEMDCFLCVFSLLHHPTSYYDLTQLRDDHPKKPHSS